MASHGFPYEGQRQPAGTRKALRADFNFVIIVRNPFNHIVFLISHMLETVVSSMDMVLRLVRGAFMGFWLPLSHQFFRREDLLRGHPYGELANRKDKGRSWITGECPQVLAPIASQSC